MKKIQFIRKNSNNCSRWKTKKVFFPSILLFSPHTNVHFSQWIYKRRMTNKSSFTYEFGVARFVKLNNKFMSAHQRELVTKYWKLYFRGRYIHGLDKWDVFFFLLQIIRLARTPTFQPQFFSQNIAFHVKYVNSSRYIIGTKHILITACFLKNVRSPGGEFLSLFIQSAERFSVNPLYIIKVHFLSFLAKNGFPK